MIPRSRMMRGCGWLLSMALLGAGCDETSAPGTEEPLCDENGLARWLGEPAIVAAGSGVSNEDCRGGELCRHNENTDLFRFQGDLFMVHRTARSQILGPNSALHVYRSRDEGVTFDRVAVLPAVNDRDIRDPIFYEVGGELFIKAITRVRGFTPRDQDVETVSVGFRSTDGVTWSEPWELGDVGWGFWRVTPHDGALYSAAYQDGDLSVVLQRSTDGVTWTPISEIYGVAKDTPLETELVVTPGGRMLAIMRMDGTDEELLGDTGRLRTKLCWADAPFEAWACPYEITGQRLDGAIHFWQDGRLFVVARKHLQPDLRKRTALFELVGDFETGPLEAVDWGNLPSASDTAYAGVAKLNDGRWLMSWYSGDVAKDQPWTAGMQGDTDIWMTTFDPTELSSVPPTPETCTDPREDAPPPPPPGDCHDEIGDPLAACGFPCEKGNTLGVGEYCTTEGGQCGDNGSATTCSDALNDQLKVKSYICTLVCDAATDCGPNASCRCPLFQDGGQICGCLPDSCVLPPDAEGPRP